MFEWTQTLTGNHPTYVEIKAFNAQSATNQGIRIHIYRLTLLKIKVTDYGEEIIAPKQQNANNANIVRERYH